MREQLLGYIAFFPGNTLFPSLLAWKETRLGIDDRVRSVLDGVVFAPAPATAATAQPGCGTGGDGVATRAFAIRHEARTGNSHMVRAAFERALAAPTTTDNGYYDRVFDHRKGATATAKSQGRTYRARFDNGIDCDNGTNLDHRDYPVARRPLQSSQPSAQALAARVRDGWARLAGFGKRV